MTYTLEPLHILHARKLHSIFSDNENLKYTDNEPSITLRDTKNVIKKYQELVCQKQAVYWSVLHQTSNEIVGFVGLYQISFKHRFASAKIIVDRCWQQKGVATTALIQALYFAFTNLKLNRVEAQVYEHHVASLLLFESLGFTKEGLLRANFLIENQFRNSVVLSVLKADYLRIYTNQHR